MPLPSLTRNTNTRMIRIFYIFCFISLFSFKALSAQNFSTHQVKEGETIEEISERYFVSILDIYNLNPDAKEGLKPNTILIIPISKAKKPKITEVKELQGFTTYKVKRKDTLFGISQEYKISIDDIKKYNTFLYASNLKKGDKLQIPIFNITKIEEKIEDYKTYTVLPKEGKWRIAYKFGISITELEALNPDIGEVLQDGQEIIVPNIDKTEQKEIDEQYSYYKVLPKEGFYRLKLKLGLNKEELQALNPELDDTGPKVGMILKIPFTDLEGIGIEHTLVSRLSEQITDFSEKHVALMLPFRLNRVDFDSIVGTKRSIEKDQYLNASLDFYSGVLVALDSLKKLGVSVKLDVYDTKYQTTAVQRILLENNFEYVDAVIGPLTAKNFDIVSSELRPYNVPVISPIGTNLKLYDNVFQARPLDDVLKTKIVNFIKQDTLPKNILIISDSKNIEKANNLRREFNNSKILFSKKDKKGRDQYFLTKDVIASALKPGKNIIFLETENKGFASNITSILAASIQEKNKYNRKEIIIRLVTTNFNNAFESNEINNTHLSKLQFTYATTSLSFDDYNNTFLRRYKRTFKTTPSKRAIKGFDLTMDVVLRLVTSEDLYLSVNNAPLTAYVENKFAYKKKLFGGYYNDAVYLVMHDNLTLIALQ